MNDILSYVIGSTAFVVESVIGLLLLLWAIFAYASPDRWPYHGFALIACAAILMLLAAVSGNPASPICVGGAAVLVLLCVAVYVTDGQLLSVIDAHEASIRISAATVVVAMECFLLYQGVFSFLSGVVSMFASIVAAYLVWRPYGSAGPQPESSVAT